MAEPEPPPEQPPVVQPSPPAPLPPQPSEPPPVAPLAPTPPPPEPEPSAREVEALASYEPSSVQLGGFLQTQYRMREDSDAQADTNGFKLARARLIGLGQTRAGNLELSAYVEAELQPTFFLTDAYATVTRALPMNARLTVDGGQMRVPISRQNLLSDSRLAFVDKAQLATIAPDRDLGVRVAFDLPRPDVKRRKSLRPPGVRVIGAVFNGEGPNQVENINQEYFYVGRMEVTALGQEQVLAESAFGGRFLKLSGSVGRNKRSEGDRLDTVTYLGVDVAGAYRGLSGSFEYLEVRHVQTLFDGLDDPNTLDFKANGFSAQLNYLLPFKLPPHKQARFELGVRLEEIDRNDTIPIVQPGEPGQSVRAITAVASYYLRMHSLKAQLAYTAFSELEDETVVGGNATFDNDQLLLQVTYRLE